MTAIGCVINVGGVKKLLKVHTNFSQLIDLATNEIGPLAPLAAAINPDPALMIPAHSAGLERMGPEYVMNGYGLFQCPAAADGISGGYTATLANRIFLLGGNPADGRMQEYNPGANTWSMTSYTISTARTTMPFVFFQNSIGIIIMGGGNIYKSQLGQNGGFTSLGAYSGDDNMLCALMTPTGEIVHQKSTRTVNCRHTGGAVINYSASFLSNPDFCSMVLAKNGRLYVSLKNATQVMIFSANPTTATRKILLDQPTGTAYALKEINNYVHCVGDVQTRLINLETDELEPASYPIFPDAYTQTFDKLDHVLPVTGVDAIPRHLLICHSGNNLAGLRFSLNSKFKL